MSRIRKFAFQCPLITLALLSSALGAQSQQDVTSLEDLYGDEDFVSIATGSVKQVDKAPAVASVITEADIKNMGARNLVEILDTVPGMHVARNGQEMSPRFWFRGIVTTFSPQALLLVDGVSTKSVVRGDNHVAWGEFPVHAISRIEIIRGPGSALYGADAFSGVINIITKGGDDIKKTELGVGYGSFDTQNFWLNTSAKLGDWHLGSSLEYLRSDGFDGIVAQDAQTQIDAIAAMFGVPPASLAPGSVSTDFEAVDLWFNAENDLFLVNLGIQDRNNIGMGAGGAEALDPSGKIGGYKQQLKLTLKPVSLSEFFRLGSEIHYYRSSQEVHENLKLFPADAFFGSFPDGFIGNPEWQEESYKVEMKAFYEAIKNHSLSFGVGGVRQNLYQVTESKNFNPDFSPRANGLEDVSDSAEVFMPEADRYNRYVYLQDIYQLAPDWELTAGVRYDDYSDFGSTTNPRLALVWSTSLDLTTKLLYGRAFRAPAFAETLVVNNPVALGNPNVKPELIDTLELAFNANLTPDLHLGLNFYRYKITDLISFVSDESTSTKTAQNNGERTGKGSEIEFSYTIGNNWRLVGNYAFVKAEDDLEDDDVGEYPAHMTYFRSEWELADNWQINTQLTLVGDRERIPGDVRQKLDGYTSADLSLAWRIAEQNTEMSLSVRNLADADIREPSTGTSDGVTPVNIPDDIPQAGRSVLLRLIYSF